MVQKKAKKKATLQNTEQARLYTLFSFLEGKRFSWNVQRNEKNVTDFARFLHAHSQDNQAMSTSFWPSPQDNSSTQLVYVNFLLFCLALFTLNCGAPRKDIRIFFFKKGVPTDCSLGCIGDRACLWTDQVPCNWRKSCENDAATTQPFWSSFLKAFTYMFVTWFLGEVLLLSSGNINRDPSRFWKERSLGIAQLATCFLCSCTWIKQWMDV